VLTIAGAIAECRAVVFDCAGTLLHLDPSPERIFQDAARELGLELELDNVARAYETVNFALKMRSSETATRAQREAFYATFNTALCNALGIHGSFDRLHPLLLARFAVQRRWVAFDDASATLVALGKDRAVHALANWDRNLDLTLERAGLRQLLTDAAASEELGAEKPARACFDAFLARNSLDPADVVYVGNEYIADVVGARQAGLTPILIDRDNRLPYADCLRVRNLLELAVPSDVRSALANL
jgi:putative hydrolase of the HAD superfamily